MRLKNATVTLADSSIGSWRSKVYKEGDVLHSHNMSEVVVEGGSLLINDVKDRLRSCHFMNTEISATVPLLISTTIIETTKAIPHTTIDKEKPHSFMLDCLLKDCKPPRGEYDTNFINGVPTLKGLTKAVIRHYRGILLKR